jgi:hypothetical protein
MTLNELLAACDYDDVKARMMLMDELHEHGRLEEEALLGWCGQRLSWYPRYQVVVADARGSEIPPEWRGINCPFCSERLPRPDGSWCPHVLYGFSQRTSAYFLYQTADAFNRPAGELGTLVLLDALGSPVVPIQPCSSVSHSEKGKPQLTECRFATEDIIRFQRAFCIPDPTAYFARIASLIRQREADGCPIALPSEEQGAD